MHIDGIDCGIVLDHIKAGMSMQIYRHLGLGRLDCCVAVIKNVRSNKMGKKDIIKIAADIDLNLDVLGYIDHTVTVNIIKDGKLTEKRCLEIPETLTDVIRCKNPRCISSSEQEITNIFKLCDREKKLYRCVYCESSDSENIIGRV